MRSVVSTARDSNLGADYRVETQRQGPGMRGTSTPNSIALAAIAIAIAAVPVSSATWFAGDFLAVGVGPRAIGMGGAVVAVVEATEAPYWNPAGLAGSTARSYAFEHAERFAGIVTHDAFSSVTPIRDGALGVMLFWGGVDGIVYTDSTSLADPTAPLSSRNLPDPDKTRTFFNADYTLSLAYGQTAFRNVRLGATVKIIRRSLDNTKASGYGVDVGAQWRSSDGAALGLVVRDVATTRVNWDNGRTDIVYPTVNIGAAHTWPLAEYQSRVTVSGAATYGAESAGYAGLAPWKLLREGNPSVVGAEYAWREAITLRVGTRDLRGFVGPGSSQLTAGVGVRTGLPWVAEVSRLGLDLSWMRHALDDSFRLGATMEM